MNTAEIISKCRDLPGVTVREGEGRTVLLLSDSEGEGRMYFYPLFPGITLAQISVRAPYWPAPRPECPVQEPRGPLIINYCTHGERICGAVFGERKQR